MDLEGADGDVEEEEEEVEDAAAVEITMICGSYNGGVCDDDENNENENCGGVN